MNEVPPQKRRAGAEDVEIGRKIRALRLERGLSQSGLADGIGLTFQQVQKYEKGTNRIGASRLEQISHVLQVPVAFFFEGAPDAPPPTKRIIDCPDRRLRLRFKRLKADRSVHAN